jgi:hypothetical protein
MCTATSPLPPAATGLLQGVSVHAECSSVQVRMLHLRSITHCMHAPAQTSLHKCTSTTLLSPAAGLLQAANSIGAAAHARQVGVRTHDECCSTRVRMRRLGSSMAGWCARTGISNACNAAGNNCCLVGRLQKRFVMLHHFWKHADYKNLRRLLEGLWKVLGRLWL